MNKIIAKATSLGLPLIGSAALELWANHLGVQAPRKPRDLDFICYDALSSKRFRQFRQWCIINNVSPDVYSVHNEMIFKYTVRVNGVLTLTLAALFYRLLERNTEQSLEDCKWILKLPEEAFSDSEFVATLEDLGIDEELYNRFNNIYEQEDI